MVRRAEAGEYPHRVTRAENPGLSAGVSDTFLASCAQAPAVPSRASGQAAAPAAHPD